MWFLTIVNDFLGILLFNTALENNTLFYNNFLGGILLTLDVAATEEHRKQLNIWKIFKKICNEKMASFTRLYVEVLLYME